MQLSSDTKELLRAAWPHLYLSEVAALLSCGYGTAYHALEEAQCFPKAPAGKPTKKNALILEQNPELIEALAKKNVTPRRYFNAIGCSIDMLVTNSDNALLTDNLSHDFPELFNLPPIFHNQRGINRNYQFARSGLGWCCYSCTYQGLVGRGKTMQSAMYRADMAFRNISAKGRLKLFLEQGMQAALYWEPQKQGAEALDATSKSKQLPKTVSEKVQQPAQAGNSAEKRQRSIAEINRDTNQVELSLKSIHPANPNAQNLKNELMQRLSKLKWELMSVEHPFKYKAHIKMAGLRQKSASLLASTKKLRDESKFDEADLLEDQFYQVENEIMTLSKMLR